MTDIERSFAVGGLVLAAGLSVSGTALGASGPLTLCAETRADGTCSFGAALSAVERQRAEDAARAIAVRVPAGLWRVAGPVEIDARHARAGWGRLTVFGEEGGGLLGGRRVGGWRKEAFNGRGDVWTADVSALGLAKAPEVLFFNGRRMTRARWPNADPKRPYSGGWAYVDGAPTGMYGKCAGASRAAFTVRTGDARTWSRPEEGLVDIFPQFNWINEERRIKAWDPATRRLTLSHGLRFEARPGDRYVLEGLREELDAPGEWHCDLAAGKLRFIPPGGEDPNAGVVSVPSGGPVLRLSGAADVDVVGLEIAEADEGLRAEGVTGVRVVGCRFRGIGGFSGSAVRIGGTRCAVVDCDVWDVGAHGVVLSGGDPATLERSGNRVENCYVHHVGRVDRHGIGVLLEGQGATVAHCLIHDMPRAALIHRGRLHTIEYNVIRDVNLETEDTGAVYGGGWVNGAGTVIRYNRISNSVGYATREGAYKFGFFASGIHFDEAIGGVEVYGNVVERANLAALNLHNARYVTVTNNVFVSNAGREGWLDQIQVQGWNADTNGYFVAQRQRSISREWHALVDVQPAWTNFPSLAHSPDDPFLPDGTVMRGNVVRDNQFFYPDQPTAVYARLRDCSLTANAFAANALCSGTNDVRVNLVGNVTLPDGAREKGCVGWAAWRRHGGDAGGRLLDAKTPSPDFSRVPLARMGLVATPRRKLPVCEAEGVREHPEWLTLPPDVPELWKEGGVSVVRGVPSLLGDARTLADWTGRRRAEVKRALEDGLYGRRPVERPADLAFAVMSSEDVFGGTAVKRLVRATCSGPGGAMALDFAAWIPKRAAKVPAFVYLSPRLAKDCDDPAKGRKEYTLPAEYIVSRGYAVVAVDDYESAPDWDKSPARATNGVFRAFGPADARARGETTWGILSAWAWGASRALDWLETEPRVDARRVAVCGLSRNGKAALVAGATDERFALAVSCCSGEGGAKLRHADCPGSETVKDISIAWRWFAPSYVQWAGRDREMPFDQHWLIALMAPRLCYVSSATADDWAGPKGEYAAAALASEAWRLYGKRGLVSDRFPAPDTPRHDGEVGYHLRTGEHALELSDWERYLDFADRHGWTSSAE